MLHRSVLFVKHCARSMQVDVVVFVDLFFFFVDYFLLSFTENVQIKTQQKENAMYLPHLIVVIRFS